MKTYRKTATVEAKLFQKGDEDGFTWDDGILEDARENAYYGIKSNPTKTVPYIATLENQLHKGEFGKQYLCIGIKGEKWLVDKEIFESTYQEVEPKELNK